MFVRQFRDADAKVVSALIIETLQEVNSKYYPAPVIESMTKLYTPEYVIQISNQRLLLVAEQFDKIMGCATINENFFGSVFVKVKYEGKGVGRKLIETLEMLAKQNGQKWVKLHASVNAVGFYEKIGYRRGKLVKDDQFGESFEMIKDL